MENSSRIIRSTMRTRSKGPAEKVEESPLPRKRKYSATSSETNGTPKKIKGPDQINEENKKVEINGDSPTKLAEPLDPKDSSTVKTKETIDNKGQECDKSLSKMSREALRLSDIEEEDTTNQDVEKSEKTEEPETESVNIKSPVKMDSLDTFNSTESSTQIASKTHSQNIMVEDRVKVRPIIMEKSKKICKSGRFWKSGRDRFSSMVTTKGLKSNLKKKNALKMELKKVKALENSIKEEAKMKKEEMKQRRLENAKRREINARKSEIVQELKNPAKIKRMKKKQLRMIAKRDLTQPEAVPVS